MNFYSLQNLFCLVTFRKGFLIYYAQTLLHDGLGMHLPSELIKISLYVHIPLHLHTIAKYIAVDLV